MTKLYIVFEISFEKDEGMFAIPFFRGAFSSQEKAVGSLPKLYFLCKRMPYYANDVQYYENYDMETNLPCFYIKECFLDEEK